MPIDPRIALGVQQSTFDPATAMQNALAIRNARLQEQANQLGLQQKQQAMQQEQRVMQEELGLRNFLAQNPDLTSADVQNRLVSQYGQKGLDILNTQQELANRRLQGKTQQLAYDKAHHDEVNTLIGDVTKYTSADQARSALDSLLEQGKIDTQTHGMYSGMIASTPWPQAKTQILGGLRTIQEQFESMQPTTTIGKLQADYDAAVKRGDKAAAAKIQQAIDVEVGGMTEYQKQQLALERQREARLAKAAETTGGGKTTVSQEQANYNVNRLLNAANQITSAMTAEEGVQKPGLKEAVVKGTFPSLAGAVQSGQRQIVDAAQTDMLDALLYLSTGAAYNKEQLEGQKKSYLPAFLDKPETVAAKQQRLITLIQDAKTRAGNAWTPDMDKKMDLILSSFKAAGTQPAAGGGAKTPTKSLDDIFKKKTP